MPLSAGPYAGPTGYGMDPYGNPFAGGMYGGGPYAGPTGMGPQNMALVPYGKCTRAFFPVVISGHIIQAF